jgi:hypothetical protein
MIIAVGLCTPALFVVTVGASVVLREPITSMIAYASPLAFSQQFISEKSPVPILRGATVRKLRYPPPTILKIQLPK